jgi:hypothetical protein
MTKQLFTHLTELVRLSFFAIAGYEAWHQDWTGVFVVVQAILISFFPYFLRRYFDIYTPFLLRIGIVFFMCSTLILGEIADFYNTYWWWDLILHGVASMGITLIVFIFLCLFFKQTHLKAAAFFTTILAIGTSLSAAVLWEIYEFTIDAFFTTDTPMQPSNVDTMTDLVISVVGAVIVGVFGYRYLKWKVIDMVSKVIHDGATRNA